MREATAGGRYLGEKGQESHKLRSKSRVTQVVMVSRELVRENRFREGIATLGIATLATLMWSMRYMNELAPVFEISKRGSTN